MQRGIARQIAANHKAVSDQIAAEDRRRDQLTQVNAVIEANELAYHVQAWAKEGTDVLPEGVRSRIPKDVDYNEESLGKRVEILGLKLRLFGMRAQNDALMRFWNQAKAQRKSDSDRPTFSQRYNELLGYLKQVVPAVDVGKADGP